MSGEDGYGWTFEATRRRQAMLGLEMTPAERLEWLERTLEELRPWVGLATEAARKRRAALGVAEPGDE
jgi:hypothetical protein